MSSLQRNVSSEQLLAEHTPALRNFFGARCRDADLTAEMLQEVAARLVTAMPPLSLNGNARGYLFRIAANVWCDHLRREFVDRKSTRLNSSHSQISYAVFCLKKKNTYLS